MAETTCCLFVLISVTMMFSLSGQPNETNTCSFENSPVHFLYFSFGLYSNRETGVALCVITHRCAACESLMHFGYYPSAVFHGRHFFADAAAAQEFKDSLHTFQVYAQTLAYITVTWATSHVVFTTPWALATFVDGFRNVPHDTPLFWTSASASFRKHWANFHTSLFHFFFANVFVPLGSGYLGTAATVAFSTAFHGFQWHWLVWGLVNGAGLMIERAMCETFHWFGNSNRSVLGGVTPRNISSLNRSSILLPISFLARNSNTASYFPHDSAVRDD